MNLRNAPISDKDYYSQAQSTKKQIETWTSQVFQHTGIRAMQKIFNEKSHRLYHWVTDRRVPCENNYAERQIRKAVLSRKVSFGSQSENGAKTRGIIMSYLTTAAIRLDGSQFIPWLKNCLVQLSLNSTADPYLLLPMPRALDPPPSFTKQASVGPRPQPTGLLDIAHHLLRHYTLLFSPIDFLRDPLQWPLILSSHKANISVAPNFAYGLITKRYQEDRLRDLDLSHLKILMTGAEPVKESTLTQFRDKYIAHGLNKDTISPVYGLAEATLIVSGRKLTDPFIKQSISKETYAENKVLLSEHSMDSMFLIGCGPASLGHEVSIVNKDTHEICLSEEVGEIWIKSPSVTLGYWQKSELTQETFHAYTADDQGPYLRTGDLGFMHEGQLFISGRAKDLIIIHGRNYYPTDIEQAIEASSEQVRPGCSVAIGVEDGEEETLHLLVELREGTERDLNEEQMQALCQKISNQVFHDCGLMPAAVLLLKAKTLDKTTSGKVRRQPNKQHYLNNELPALHSSAHTSKMSVSSRFQEEKSIDIVDSEWPVSVSTIPLPYTGTENQIKLKMIWSEVLGIEIDEEKQAISFIGLGGQSLLIGQLQQRIFEEFGVNLPVTVIFQHNTLANMVYQIESLKLAVAPKFEIDFSSKRYAASAGQRRFWFLDQLLDNKNTYNEFVRYQWAGQYNEKDFLAALALITNRHESLRSAFLISANGDIEQEIVDDVEIPYSFRQRSEILEDIMRDFSTMTFDLTKAPLWRAQIIQLSSEEYMLQLVFHHSIIDGHSIQNFIKELMQFYVAITENKLPQVLATLPSVFQYRQFCAMEEQWLHSGEGKECALYWKKRLAAVESLQAFPKTTQSLSTQESPKQVHGQLSVELHADVKKYCAELSVTPFSFYLSVFSLLMSHYMQNSRVVINTVITNRYLLSEKDGIGFFVNTLPLLQNVNFNQSMDEWLPTLWRELREDITHSQLPYDEILKHSSVPSDWLQTFFIYQENLEGGLERLAYRDVNLQKHNVIHTVENTSKSDFSMEFIESSSHHIDIFVGYNHTVYSSAFVEEILQRYQNLLQKLLSYPRRALKEIDLLTPSERQQQLVEWNATDAAYPEQFIQELFEEQARKTPNKIAMVYEEQEITYSQLNERANQVAFFLRSQGVAPNQVIGIGTERSFESFIAVLGIIKAGAGYVPIDPNYPDERLYHMVADTNIEFLLTQTQLINRWGKLIQGITHSRPPLVLALDSPEFINSEHVSDLPIVNQPSDLAYIIYTSGSTGQPKGVMISHKSLVNICTESVKYRHVTPDSQVLQMASLNFDPAVAEWTSTLTQGATLYLLSSRHPTFDALQLVLQKHRIDTTTITPSFLRQLPEDSLVHLKTLVVGGEALDEPLFKYWRERVQYFANGYGPTESTVATTIATYEKGSARTALCIGRPIGNRQLYVLSEHMQLVPVGVPGELYIGGDGLAIGYLNQPKLTEERFILHDFGDGKGAIRLYRTGDLVRYLPDGYVEFIGRIDQQIKIHGFRVELGEIESRLKEIPGIKQGLVIAKENNLGHKYLVAYIVSDEPSDIASIKHYLSLYLPEHMIPAQIVSIEKIPLTVNGKVDYKKLPQSAIESQDTYAAPGNEVETDFCNIWAEVLGLARVGIDDNFFEIGGSSILSMQLATRLSAAGYECKVKTIFENKTIRLLSKALRPDQQMAALVVEEGVLEGDFDLLPMQRYFYESAHSNKILLIKTPRLNVSRLNESLPLLVNQHDALRLVFHDGIQKYDNEMLAPTVKALSTEGINKSEMSSILTLSQNVTGEAAPLWQIVYIDNVDDNNGQLGLVLDRRAFDETSSQIILEDLYTLYYRGNLGDKTSSYRQWSRIVNDYVQTHADERQYWEDVVCDQQIYGSESEIVLQEFELSQPVTQDLLRLSSKIYETDTYDLLLTALAYALKDWSHSEINHITLWKNGRVKLDSTIDISRTVGCFDTLHPVKLVLADGVENSIQSIKESLRTAPNEGLGYSALRYRPLSNSLQSNSLPGIGFNYSESFHLKTEAWELIDNLSIGQQDNFLMDIRCYVANGQLKFCIASKVGNKISSKFAQSLKDNLEGIVSHCKTKAQTETHVYLPADFLVDDSDVLFLSPKKTKRRPVVFFIHPVTGFVRIPTKWITNSERCGSAIPTHLDR